MKILGFVLSFVGQECKDTALAIREKQVDLTVVGLECLLPNRIECPQGVREGIVKREPWNTREPTHKNV